MKILVYISLVFFLLSGGALNVYRLGAEQREERRKAQWQSAVVDQVKPRSAVKWSERAIDASVNGLRSVPPRHLP